MAHQPLGPRWRLLTELGAGLYGLSLALLLIASTRAEELPAGALTPLGVTDVATALAVVGVAFALALPLADRVGPRALRFSYALITYAAPLLLAGLWVYRAHLLWNVLLPGLAWRAFVLLLALPAAVSVWRPEASAQVPA